jgi:hypothetical protein
MAKKNQLLPVQVSQNKKVFNFFKSDRNEFMKIVRENSGMDIFDKLQKSAPGK